MAYGLHMPSSNYVTTREAAEVFDVSFMTVTRWMRAGRLTPVRTRPYMFDRSEVERIATERKSA